MTAPSIWSEHLDSEVAFWERWLTSPEFEQHRVQRLQNLQRFPRPYIDLLKLPRGARVRAIDVGSGPITTLGLSDGDYDVELVCTDALADKYNDLLARTGYDNLPRIVQVKGEDLLTMFGASSFDVVHCANALDHFDDPATSFVNMYSLSRPRGALVVISIENEGERERYHGLHQWNLRTDDQGVWLWNPRLNQNLLSSLEGKFDFSWDIVNQTKEFRVFRAIIRKMDMQ